MNLLSVKLISVIAIFSFPITLAAKNPILKEDLLHAKDKDYVFVGFSNIPDSLRSLGANIGSSLKKNTSISIDQEIYAKYEHEFSVSNLGVQPNKLLSYLSLQSYLKSLNRWFNSPSDAQSIQYRRSYLVYIVALMHHIYDIASKKGDEFSRGAYVIHDPKKSLFEFLRDYTRLAVPQFELDHKLYSVPGFSIGNSFAYQRHPDLGHSSHLVDPKFQAREYGIDMRFLGDGPALPLLPNGKTHLLFGRFFLPGSNVYLTFLKFEEYGVGNFEDWFNHAYKTFYSVYNGSESIENDRREKTMPLKVINFAYEHQIELLPNESVAEIRAKLPPELIEPFEGILKKHFNDQYGGAYRIGRESTLSVFDL